MLQLPLLFLTTIFSIALLYAPQPLLPLFSQIYQLPSSTAALLVTLSLLPLSIAPLCFGYLLQTISPVRLLRLALFGLAITSFLFARSDSMPIFLTLRLVQGILLPAVLTSLMTIISNTIPPQQMQRTMSFYIASTTTGGCLGRLLSGVFTSFFGWPFFFYLLGIGLLACAAAIRPGPASLYQQDRATPRLVWQMVRNAQFWPSFLVAFIAFFCLSSIMNFIPYRVRSLNPEAPAMLYGFVYTGYFFGIISATTSSALLRRIGSESKTMVLGFGAMLTSLALLALPKISLIIATMFILTGAMFLVHSIAAGKVNRQAEKEKGLVNGMYVACYYAGGTCGSYLPGFIYEHFGWHWFLLLVITVCFGGLILATLKFAGKMADGAHSIQPARK